jgi:hypothetical protein
MTQRTTATTVTFANAFRIEGYEQELPPGDYVVETNEDLIQELSFPVYRRVSTMLQVERIPGRPGETQVWSIDPEALEAALQRDKPGS